MARKNETTTTRFATDCVHAGYHGDPEFGAVNPSIELSTTFVQPSPANPLKFDYARGGNPTREVLESAIGQLEAASHAFAFASGLAAFDALLRTIPSGSNVVCAEDAYGGSIRLLNRIHSPKGLEVTFVDTQDLAAVEAAVTNSTSWVILETPTNPLLRVSDIRGIVAIAHRCGAKVLVDSTFMSPALQQPLRLGADAVFHSATKYLGGHSDVLGGVIATSDKPLADQLQFVQMAAGAVLSPFDSYMLLRGIKTLHLRMQTHSTSGGRIARFLVQRLGEENVYYPGLKSHANHEVHASQASGSGGMLSFRVKNGKMADKIVKATQIFQLAESLGAVESLIQIPAKMTHASVPAEMRARTGITDGLIRVSVGIEDCEDLIADLDQALRAAKAY